NNPNERSSTSCCGKNNEVKKNEEDEEPADISFCNAHMQKDEWEGEEDELPESIGVPEGRKNTLKENVLLKVHRERIDMKELEKCIQDDCGISKEHSGDKAHCSAFIGGKLPKKKPHPQKYCMSEESFESWRRTNQAHDWGNRHQDREKQSGNVCKKRVQEKILLGSVRGSSPLEDRRYPKQGCEGKNRNFWEAKA
ncbi:MAG: hypothetical protein IH969_09930, partial [Candidatus Krumholzibacteriota bacterium]|nr:hypothetical protein [Candidatus Krumholzibacteriota bacterium]